MDETQLCKGRVFCPNKNDIRWCENSTNHNLKPLPSLGPEYYKCSSSPYHNITIVNGQWIKQVEKDDSLVYQCLNRGDENPFGRQKIREDACQDGSNKNWRDCVETPCEDYTKRRCLGDRPDHCVYDSSKF